MTVRELREMENHLEPCHKCGGKLVVNRTSGYGNKKPFEHYAIRCKQCGEWCGGLTRKWKERKLHKGVV